MKNKSRKLNKAFTLIELLVVVAIIGILSAVVVSSLSSAREKGKIATIKSTLKQLYNQASLNYLNNGSFAGLNDASLNCTGSDNNLQKIAQTLIDQGIFVKCYSHNNSSFGATAILYDTTILKAWSVDENGVVKWDTQGVNTDGTTRSTDLSMIWDVANSACALSGGRLPTVEDLKTLSDATYTASGGATRVPPSFTAGAGYYWSSTMMPPNSTYDVYLVRFSDGAVGFYYKQPLQYGVRCVR